LSHDADGVFEEGVALEDAADVVSCPSFVEEIEYFGVSRDDHVDCDSVACSAGNETASLEEDFQGITVCIGGSIIVELHRKEKSREIPLRPQREIKWCTSISLQSDQLSIGSTVKCPTNRARSTSMSMN
jgi:hypothetical protein